VVYAEKGSVQVTRVLDKSSWISVDVRWGDVLTTVQCDSELGDLLSLW
jgi:hypothetical protein